MSLTKRVEIMANWEHILVVGRVSMINTAIKPRRVITHDGITYMMTHVVWNVSNPDDLVHPGDNIHHIDGDALNDDMSNLQKMTRSEHSSFHSAGRVHSTETIEKFRNKVFTDEHRENLRIAQTGKTYSDESRLKMSESKRRSWANGLYDNRKPKGTNLEEN